MSQGNIKIILVLLAVAMVGGAYMYLFKPNLEERDSVQSEVNNLQARYDDLKAKEQHREEYVQETEDYNRKFELAISEFPATLDQEISVVFMKGIEKNEVVAGTDMVFDIESVGMGREELFYSMGAGVPAQTGADGALVAPSSYECYRAAFPISYNGSYEGLKDLVDYIMNYKYRMNISSISVAYDTTAETYSGTINLIAYCISGEGREADAVNVDVPNGVSNLFLGGEGAVNSNSYAYDSDNGASIVSKHNLTIVLNNANNDNSDGIIVSAGGSNTSVSSSANSTERLTLSIYEEDGKNYVDYSIGDSSKTVEITGADLTVYVESSARVDGDDLNGVRVTVDNKTSIPVFFKVDGDDTSSPRFVMGSKTGTVKVY